MQRNEDSLRDLWNNIKHTNNGILGVPKGNRQTWENIWRHNSWKRPQHKKGNTQIQEEQSLIQNKPKEEEDETYINHTEKN